MTGVVATILGWIAQGSAFLSLPQAFPFHERVRVLLAWALTCPILFILREPLLILLVAACALALLAPTAPQARVAFFLAVAPCLPFYLMAPLPFPGLTQLFTLTHYKAAVLVVLLPILFSTRKGTHRPAPLSTAEILFAAFFVYTAAIVLLDTNFTNALRFLVDHALTFALPYFIIRNTVRSVDDFDACARGFLIASAMLGFIAIVSAGKSWDFYRHLFPPSVFAIADTRTGFIRIEATVNTHSLGYHLAAGLVVLQYLRTRIDISAVKTWGLRGLFLAGIFFTNSRGAMLGLLVAGSAYVLLATPSRAARHLLAAAYVAALAAAAYWLVTQDTSGVDPYGTVAYRQELLATSVRAVLDNPVFGDVNYLNSGKFDRLVQGLGIIDITNFYLQLALSYGLLGLILFMSVFAGHLSGLVRRPFRQDKPKPGPDVAASSARSTALAAYGLPGPQNGSRGPRAPAGDVRKAYNTTACIVLGWLALVTTTSDMGVTIHIGLAFAALGCAVRIRPRTLAGQPAMPRPAPELNHRPASINIG